MRRGSGGNGKRVLITGASGFTGRHACEKFMEAGWEVVAVVSPRNAGDASIAAAHVESCDLTDQGAVSRLFKLVRPDAAVHLAGRNAVDFSWRDPSATLAMNFMSTVFVLEAIRETVACAALIIGSTLRADPAELAKAVHPYSFSKTLQVAAAEAWHRWYGFPVMVAEPSNLIGPGHSNGLCGKIARWVVAEEEGTGQSRPFCLSSLNETRDFLDVRDAVGAYLTIVDKGKPGEKYAVQSGKSLALRQIKEAFDSKASVELKWTIGKSKESSPPSRDASALRGLGWTPAFALSESIRDLLEYERRKRAAEKTLMAEDTRD